MTAWQIREFARWQKTASLAPLRTSRDAWLTIRYAPKQPFGAGTVNGLRAPVKLQQR